MSEASDFLSDSHPKLPVDWSWRLFTDVMDIEGGAQPPASEFVDDLLPGHVRLVQIRDFDSDAHLTYIPDSKKWRKCENRDVLIARYGAALGRICRGLSGAYNVALAKVIPSEYVEIDFVNYLLRSHWFQAPLLASGGRSAQAGFNKATLAVIPLPIPPLREQRAIAGVLGALDDKIEHERRTAQALEQLARAIFRTWFVDFEPVKAKAAGATGFPSMPQQVFDSLPTRFVDSDIGPVPEGWGATAISSVGTLVSGGTPKRSEPAYWGGDVPWYSVKDAPRDGEIWVFNTSERITDNGLLNSAARIVPKGCTIISARGTVGKLAMAGTPMAFNQSCYGLLPSDDASFCHLHLLMQTIVANLQQRTHGSVFDTITRATFDGLLVAKPAGDVVSSFEAVVTPIFDLLLASLQESSKLAEMRDYLLPKLLSGQVRVEAANG